MAHFLGLSKDGELNNDKRKYNQAIADQLCEVYSAFTPKPSGTAHRFVTSVLHLAGYRQDRNNVSCSCDVIFACTSSQHLLCLYTLQVVQSTTDGTGGKEAIAAVYTLLETQRLTVTEEVLKQTYFYVSPQTPSVFTAPY